MQPSLSIRGGTRVAGERPDDASMVRPLTEREVKLWNFLAARECERKSFASAELAGECGYRESSVAKYLSSRLNGLVVVSEEGRWRVTHLRTLGRPLFALLMSQTHTLVGLPQDEASWRGWMNALEALAAVRGWSEQTSFAAPEQIATRKLTAREERLWKELIALEQAGSTFSTDDLGLASGYAPSTVRSYLGKRLNDACLRSGRDQWRVERLSTLGRDGFARRMSNKWTMWTVLPPSPAHWRARMDSLRALARARGWAR